MFNLFLSFCTLWPECILNPESHNMQMSWTDILTIVWHIQRFIWHTASFLYTSRSLGAYSSSWKCKWMPLFFHITHLMTLFGPKPWRQNRLRHPDVILPLTFLQGCMSAEDCGKGRYCLYDTRNSKCLPCKAIDVVSEPNLPLCTCSIQFDLKCTISWVSVAFHHIFTQSLPGSWRVHFDCIAVCPQV